MNNWIIKYWSSGSGKSDLERWVSKLTLEQFKSISKELTLLRKCGSELGLPHSRSLGKGLFELRERRFGYRM